MFIKWKGSMIHEADRVTRLVTRRSTDLIRIYPIKSRHMQYGYTLCGRTVPDGAKEVLVAPYAVKKCILCARKAPTQTQKER